MQSNEVIPAPINVSILAVVFCGSYPVILSCIMSDPTQVLISLIAGVLSFLAIPGRNSKMKLLVSTVLSMLLFFMPEGNVRAFFIGFSQSYSQTVAEIYTSNLSLVSFREMSVSLLGILTTMQSCFVFLLLAFLPWFAPLFSSFFCVFALISLEVAALLLCTPTPPSELLENADVSILYGDVYKNLASLFRNTPFAYFHREYTALVVKYNKKPIGTYARLCTIIEKVNISFISTGVLGLLSTISHSSIYLSIFSCVSMFKWIYANRYPKDYLILSIVCICLVLISMVLYQVKPIFIILMAASLYLVPSSTGYISLDRYTIGISNTVRNSLGVLIYMLLLKEQCGR
ncbi:uncharacterized protein NEMAJ01_0928 [Nematocida major]|uniref:uncharacterized protein n=1 Tax=Nematocida major TaxID=1912982 RepID=UPI0020080FBD|nr:uncharacterized protein NEMAJ01_0928 [Nematocida major]KAH9386032.1 hypothetical protein NEMAJ01_0928 [Nematocida major]